MTAGSNMIIIKHPKGLAYPATAPHTYQLKDQLVIIKAKKVTEEHTETIKLENISETKKSTVFSVFDVTTNVEIIMMTLDGDKKDEDCLALMGWYLSDYDEQKEAQRIKRLVDIAKFL